MNSSLFSVTNTAKVRYLFDLLKHKTVDINSSAWMSMQKPQLANISFSCDHSTHETSILAFRIRLEPMSFSLMLGLKCKNYMLTAFAWNYGPISVQLFVI